MHESSCYGSGDVSVLRSGNKAAADLETSMYSDAAWKRQRAQIQASSSCFVESRGACKSYNLEKGLLIRGPVIILRRL